MMGDLNGPRGLKWGDGKSSPIMRLCAGSRCRCMSTYSTSLMGYILCAFESEGHLQPRAHCLVGAWGDSRGWDLCQDTDRLFCTQSRWREQSVYVCWLSNAFSMASMPQASTGRSEATWRVSDEWQGRGERAQGKSNCYPFLKIHAVLRNLLHHHTDARQGLQNLRARARGQRLGPGTYGGQCTRTAGEVGK